MNKIISTKVTDIEALEEPKLIDKSLHDELQKLLPPLPYDSVNGGQWITLEEDDVMDMFKDLNTFKEETGKVDWDKINYEIYGEDWYREKFPHFPDEWYALMVKASNEKYKNLQKKETHGLSIDRGKFTVKFE